MRDFNTTRDRFWLREEARESYELWLKTNGIIGNSDLKYSYVAGFEAKAYLDFEELFNPDVDSVEPDSDSGSGSSEGA